ncbi:MAG TPA: ATP-dependent Clp protease ATP-binding subunit, partial [Candidatus Moranbacteria bacterium]|nr:ATP-dependent Clp protease ATP-binding subunit [Candidatus Moranbacteria bacterium]
LLGAPAGYVGYGEGGHLTERVRRQPYSLILFDEIEKAHPEIFNILLQLLEEGFLTDAEGRSVDFRNTIIILTSNIGTGEFSRASAIGFEKNLTNKKQTDNLQDKFSEIKNRVIGELREKMKPEILNRLDYIVVFDVLSKKDLIKIADLELKKLKKRLEKRHLKLNYSKKIANLLADKSFSETKGARLVKEKIRDLIEIKLAETLGNHKNTQPLSEMNLDLDKKNEQIIIKTKSISD